MSLFSRLIISAFIFFAAACARMGMPPGGPEDVEPPGVASLTPASDSTGVATGSTLEIEFTEDVYIQWPLLTASVRVDPSALNDLAADMLGERDLDKSIKDLIGKRKQKP